MGQNCAHLKSSMGLEHPLQRWFTPMLLVGGLNSSLAFGRRSQLLSIELLTSSIVSDPREWGRSYHVFYALPSEVIPSLLPYSFDLCFLLDGIKEWMPEGGDDGAILKGSHHIQKDIKITHRSAIQSQWILAVLFPPPITDHKYFFML